MAGAKGRERGQANVRPADTNYQETPEGGVGGFRNNIGLPCKMTKTRASAKLEYQK